MKKVICITIALCLVFASVLPVYADAWTSQQASSVTQAVTGILTSIVNNGIGFTEWATLLGNGNAPAYYHSFQDLYNRIDWALSWIVPNTLHGQTDPTIMDSLIVLTNYAMNHLPDISSIAGYVASWMSSNNNYLNSINNYDSYLKKANAYNVGSYGSPWNASDILEQAHYYLFDVDSNLTGTQRDGRYHTSSVSANGQVTNSYFYWQDGTPLGNIALILRHLTDNVSNSYGFRWAADLKHYNDNLTTWDSQGSSLTQVGFTPESAIQGLYRYLAFTQRDVARLAYVFANDEELEARELVQANQEQVLDDFIDPNGSGSVSPTDLGNMTDASDGFKSNFSTNVGSSHIWDVFDNSRYNWFTQQTKNQLDTTQQTRSLKAVSNDYPTPLLDNYYNEIFGIIGVDIND